MLNQDRGGMLDQLCPEDLLLLRTNGGRPAGMGPWIETACLANLLTVALDRRDADTETAGDFTRSSTGINCGHDA